MTKTPETPQTKVPQGREERKTRTSSGEPLIMTSTMLLKRLTSKGWLKSRIRSMFTAEVGVGNSELRLCLAAEADFPIFFLSIFNFLFQTKQDIRTSITRAIRANATNTFKQWVTFRNEYIHHKVHQHRAGRERKKMQVFPLLCLKHSFFF